MKTALYDRHQGLGAKMISFAGWEMPIYYKKGIIAEHRSVRQAVGLFDISHMGRIVVEGPDAVPFLDYLSTNKIEGKANGSAIYTVWCHEDGGSVDDVIIYKQAEDKLFVVANAANRQKDLHHLLNQKAHFNVSIQDRFQEDGILALQGPLAESVLERFFPEIKQIKAMHFATVKDINNDKNLELIISRTGYTGAGGFELYGLNAQIVQWWDRLLSVDIPTPVEPIGLGARDTLRLEMGFALYGHELSDTIAPSESVSAWTIKWQKENFLGKKALEALEKRSLKRNAYGIQLTGAGIAREGYPVFQNGVKIGEVTSGSFSPTLSRAIALILVTANLKIGDTVDVQLRQQLCQAQVTQLPFVRKNA